MNNIHHYMQISYTCMNANICIHQYDTYINRFPDNAGAIAIEEGENPGGPFAAPFDVCELRTLNPAPGSPPLSRKREFFIDDLLKRIHYTIVMIQ